MSTIFTHTDQPSTASSFSYNRGQGYINIYNLDNALGRREVLSFGEGIRPQDLILTKTYSGQGDYYHLTIEFKNSPGDKILVSFGIHDNYYEKFTAGVPYDGGANRGNLWHLDGMTFADGTVWNYKDISSGNGPSGGGNETPEPPEVPNDGVIFTHADQASTASNFSYNRGQGYLNIYNIDNALGRREVLNFGAGISPQDLVLTKTYSGQGEYYNLTIEFKNSPGDKIMVSFGIHDNYYEKFTEGVPYDGGANRGNLWHLDGMTFADGTVWNYKTISNMVNCNTYSDSIIADPNSVENQIAQISINTTRHLTDSLNQDTASNGFVDNQFNLLVQTVAGVNIEGGVNCDKMINEEKPAAFITMPSQNI